MVWLLVEFSLVYYVDGYGKWRGWTVLEELGVDCRSSSKRVGWRLELELSA